MFLYHKGIPILEFDEKTLTVIRILESKFLPNQLLQNNGAMFQVWLMDRGLDLSLSVNRELIKNLNLSSKLDAVLFANAQCMSDHFWINRTMRNYSEHIRFQDNAVSISSLTSIGSFKKRWERNKLYKSGNEINNLAEVWNMELCEALGVPTAKYYLVGKEVVSPNFTNENNYLEHQAAAKSTLNWYTDIFTLDALTSNPDRHEYNYGVLRCTTTGDILCTAPNFDNNLGWGCIPENGHCYVNS